MKKSYRFTFLIFILIVLSISGCRSSASNKSGSPAALTGSKNAKVETIKGIDPLISAISDKTLSILKETRAWENSKTLAVYYFTLSQGRGQNTESGISDYLISGITTSLAGKSSIKIVSRQVLDRVLKESAFQMTDLVDKKAQIDIGKLLGADLILTGFITLGDNVNRLNVQIIQVETGIVIGGFILNINLEPQFEKKLASRGSEIIVEKAGEVSQEGNVTVTRIFASFNESVMYIELSHDEEHWGDKVLDSSGDISRVEKGGIDESPFILYSFKGKIDNADIYREWEDSDLNFNLIIDPKRKLENFNGISIAIKPEGFSKAYIILNQEDPEGNTISFSVPVLFRENQWQEAKIPFNTFEPNDKGMAIDTSKSAKLAISIPFLENYHQFHFRTGKNIEGKLSVDNIGYYTLKNKESSGYLEGFNDELESIVFTGEIAEASYYTDYSKDDEGIVKKTPGINKALLTLEKKSGGVRGKYLNFSGHLDITKDFKKYIDSGQTLNVVLRGSLGMSFKGFKRLNFYVISKAVSEGQIDYNDLDNDTCYSSDFRVSGIWGRVSIPFSDFKSDNGALSGLFSGPLSPTQKYGNHVVLSLMFPLNNKLIRDSLKKGKLDFEIGLDEFSLD